MTIPPECEAQILRYFHVEKWPPTTIAPQLNINRGTVKRVLAQAGLPPIGLRPRPARIDPYLPFIHQTLEKFPMLAASRLYVMVHERGAPTKDFLRSASAGVGRSQKAILRARLGRAFLNPAKDGDLRTDCAGLKAGGQPAP